MNSLLRRRVRSQVIAMLILALSGVVLLGCSGADVQSWFEELQSLISPLPSPTPTSVATPTPVPVSTATATPASSDLVLSFWVPDFLNPFPEDSRAEVLATQVARFAMMSPEVQVKLQVKKAEGEGGLYDLMSAASGVAPSIMPDLLVLGSQDLLVAASEGLLQPLDGYLPADAGYFPAALDDVRTTENLWAFPYVAMADQMAYRSTVTVTPPISWTAVLSNGFSIVLPGAAAETTISDIPLAMYIGAGGRTVDATGQATLDRVVLERLYGFVLDAQRLELLNSDQVLALSDTETCWQVYRANGVALTPVSIGEYWNAYLNTPIVDVDVTLTPGAQETETGVTTVSVLPVDTLPTWVPTVKGQPITVMRTYGLAIVTQDPVRQQAALELLRWLVSAQQMGELTLSAGLTPTRRQAVEAWKLPPDDEAFVMTLLTNAVSAPPTGADLIVRRALQAGMTAILQGEATSADAAASLALTNLRR